MLKSQYLSIPLTSASFLNTVREIQGEWMSKFPVIISYNCGGKLEESRMKSSCTSEFIHPVFLLSTTYIANITLHGLDTHTSNLSRLNIILFPKFLHYAEETSSDDSAKANQAGTALADDRPS